jgi:lipoprotein signal peptidase
MKDFFIRMLSAKGGISSKRFSSFFTLVNVIILTYVATFYSESKQAPEYMFDALALIAGGGLGLTVIEKIFSKREDSKKQTPEDEEPIQ